ncbi:MAG: M23 family metallopeptidase [Acidobacteriota bacterium]
MNNKKLKIYFLIFIFSCSIKGIAYQTEILETNKLFTVKLQYRATHPGEILLINIDNSENINSVEVYIFNRVFSTIREYENLTPIILIGIDLETKPGIYKMIIYLNTKKGENFKIEKSIRILGKKFPLKKLWVDEKYVVPPPEALERIKKEKEILNSIWKTVTPNWFINGNFITPLEGKGKFNFGERRIFNRKYRSIHSGEDLISKHGDDIKASNDGKVVLAQELYFSGNTVIIDHGKGLYTLYCHLSSFNIKKDEFIKKGDIIGKVGATGRAIGPHLHWGVKLYDSQIDPYSLLSMPLDLFKNNN